MCVGDGGFLFVGPSVQPNPTQSQAQVQLLRCGLRRRLVHQVVRPELSTTCDMVLYLGNLGR